MKKKIKICGTEYEICTNGLTMFLYKKEFKTGIMADISRLQRIYLTKVDTEGKTEEEAQQELGIAMMPQMDDYIEVALRIAYILIKTGNRDFMSFDDFVQTIDQINIFEDKWIDEVTELAVNSFCGQGIGGTTQATQE